jgi:hypothetical protein
MEDKMDLDYFFSQMTDNAQRIRALAKGVSDDQARWKPDLESWSILEVVNHLLDEEREDFRVMLDLALHRPDQPRPRIDPQAWVTEREYNERDLEASLRGFLAAREESLTWLRGLSSPDWQVVYEAPFGPIKAGDIFASWVAHDLLHIRQFVGLHWAYTTYRLHPYKVDYAGQW